MAAFLPKAGSAFAADGVDIVSLGSLDGIQDGNLSANPAGNDLGVRFIIPQHGDRWHFR